MRSAQIKRPLQERALFRVFLALFSGIMLGFSFPPSPLYSLAYVAFVPILYLFVILPSYKKIAEYAYLFLFLFHLLTVYWTGGFVIGKDVWMMTAGAAVILLHPLFFLPFILLAFFVKKRLGLLHGLISFALFWTSFEYLHSLGEYSFPWLTVGNSQAYDIYRIQMIEYTSVYGLSIIIFTFNIAAFFMMWNTANGNWNFRSWKTFASLILLVIVYFAPSLYGAWVLENSHTDTEKKIAVGIVQPNFDPWDKWGEGREEKWMSYLQQFDTYMEETKTLSLSKPDIVFWPETAIPFHILLPRYTPTRLFLQSLVDSLRLPVFTGLPTIEFFDSLHAPATSERIGTSHVFVESYNSSILFQPNREPGPMHKKTILVPFAERIPYAETFRFLIEPLKWNVGISSWGKGEDTVVYHVHLASGETAKFSGMICYESAYPNYVREFVRCGAEFLVIITNDSWWGNTSGAYQHASFAILRAIETRRWIVQCANGGISMIVDPYGTAYFTTNLYSQARFIGDLGLRKEKTFYVQYGDRAAQCCLVASAVMIIAAFIFKKKEKR